MALESGFIFLAKHKFKNFVLTVCEINSYWFSTWDWLHHGRVRRKLGAPKLWAKSEEEKIHTQVAHRVKWTIYLFYWPISRTYFPVGHFWLVNTVMRSIRTPGTNPGLDIQNLNFHVREVPFEVALTLWRIPITPWYFGVIVLKLSNLFFFWQPRASQNHESLAPSGLQHFRYHFGYFFFFVDIWILFSRCWRRHLLNRQIYPDYCDESEPVGAGKLRKLESHDLTARPSYLASSTVRRCLVGRYLLALNGRVNPKQPLPGNLRGLQLFKGNGPKHRLRRTYRSS